MVEAKFSAGEISGEITVPGSKSFTQRYILLSAFSGIPVDVENTSGSEDEQIALEIAERTGAKVTRNNSNISIMPEFSCPEVIDAGESATSLRIVIALLAGRHCSTEIRMRSSLRTRNSRPIMSALESLGTVFTDTENGLKVDGSNFKSGNIRVSGELSSQFTTAALLLQALEQKGDRSVTVEGKNVSEGYVAITVKCLDDFGVRVARENSVFTLSGNLSPHPGPVVAETDMSSLSFLLALGVLGSQRGITIRGISAKGLQPDQSFIEILQVAGFDVVTEWNSGTATAKKSQGGHITIDASSTPDLAVIASVIGIFSKEGVSILNPARLSGKESDRKKSIIELAASFGALVTEETDRIEIRGTGNINTPERLYFRDHRVVMAAIIAALASGTPTEIGDIEAIRKSYPSFLDTLEKVGVTTQRTA